jgi:hypothetical protein
VPLRNSRCFSLHRQCTRSIGRRRFHPAIVGLVLLISGRYNELFELVTCQLILYAMAAASVIEPQRKRPDLPVPTVRSGTRLFLSFVLRRFPAGQYVCGFSPPVFAGISSYINRFPFLFLLEKTTSVLKSEQTA